MRGKRGGRGMRSVKVSRGRRGEGGCSCNELILDSYNVSTSNIFGFESWDTAQFYATVYIVNDTEESGIFNFNVALHMSSLFSFTHVGYRSEHLHIGVVTIVIRKSTSGSRVYCRMRYLMGQKVKSEGEEFVEKMMSEVLIGPVLNIPTRIFKAWTVCLNANDMPQAESMKMHYLWRIGSSQPVFPLFIWGMIEMMKKKTRMYECLLRGAIPRGGGDVNGRETQKVRR